MSQGAERLAAVLERALADPPRDHVRLRERAAEVLRRRFPYDLGVWATVDPLSTMWTSCVLDGFDPDPGLERAVFSNEYGQPDVLKLRDLAVGGVRSGGLVATTGGDPATSPRFREIYEPRGVTDEARVLLRDGSGTWGALVLLRTGGAFRPDELATLEGVARPLAARLRTALLVETAAAGGGGGAVLCDPSGRVRDVSAEAAALLGGGPDAFATPLAAAVTRFEHGDGAESVLPAPGGGWLTLTCSRLSKDVVVVVDRIRPDRLAEVLIAAAGLTPRERDVLRELLAGRTSRRVADRLRMSEHTVNDHLKRIFAKFGVGSRAELVADLFFRHYADAHARGERPSAAGHYLTSSPARVDR